MTQTERYQLYEKLYFHELERREKISARLALPFAAIIAVVGLLSFMLNATTKPQGDLWLSLFWLLFSTSSSAILVGAWFFRKAWFGHEDKLLPTPNEMERYHSILVDTYAEFENCQELVEKYFSDFIFDSFMRFSSANAVSNDQRSYNIYRANVGMTIAILLALAAAVPFYIGKPAPGESENGKAKNTSTATSPSSASQR